MLETERQRGKERERDREKHTNTQMNCSASACVTVSGLKLTGRLHATSVSQSESLCSGAQTEE